MSFTHFFSFKELSKETPERVTFLYFLMPSAIEFHPHGSTHCPYSGNTKETARGKVLSFYIRFQICISFKQHPCLPSKIIMNKRGAN